MNLRGIGSCVLGALGLVGVAVCGVFAAIEPQSAPASAPTAPSSAPTAAASRPASMPATSGGHVNVVIYLIDTLRVDRIGAYGSTRNLTPTIDELAAQGVTFEHHSAASCWTLPSITSLLTSTPVCEHGVVVDGQKVPAALPTLAERLKRGGWMTGSFYTNPFAGQISGLNRGFDTWTLVKSRDAFNLTVWLDRVKDKPSFTYIHTTEPHDPYRIRDRYRDMIKPPLKFDDVNLLNAKIGDYRRLTKLDYAAKTPIGSTDRTADIDAALRELVNSSEAIQQAYDISVLWADANLKQVIKQLKSRGIWDNTLFVLTSDHGEEFAEHGQWQHDQSAFEELLHTPLIIKFPDNQHAGVRVKEPVCGLDVLPTILDALGRNDLLGDVSGRSVLPLARGEKSPPRGMFIPSIRHNVKKFYRPAKQTRGDVNVVVRDGMWKLIWNADAGNIELYDLEKDPREKTNVAATQRERAERMGKFAVDQYQTCVAHSKAEHKIDLSTTDAKERRVLEQLGYLGGTREGDDEDDSP